MSMPSQPGGDFADSVGESVGDGREEPEPVGETHHQRQGQLPVWSDEDWRLWNEGRWGNWSWDHPATSEYEQVGGYTSRDSRDETNRRTSMATDPWNRPASDPWSQSHAHGKDDHLDERTGGTSDKIVVPEFTGEEDREGTKARSYLRKIEAWKRVTRLKPNKQALVLYNGLSGKAWRDAEDLDVSQLDHPQGVERFVFWITQRYLDKEVVKAGKYMSGFFKHFKRSQNQDIRDFNSEFDRHLSKLREVGCQLPGTCSSWWYVDKLRLDNTTELSLLSSVNNQYDLVNLQEAAVVQDRMNRRLWETSHKSDVKGNLHRRSQQALCTELDEAPADDEEMDDSEPYDEEDGFTEDDPETHEAYMSPSRMPRRSTTTS